MYMGFEGGSGTQESLYNVQRGPHLEDVVEAAHRRAIQQGVKLTIGNSPEFYYGTDVEVVRSANGDLVPLAEVVKRRLKAAEVAAGAKKAKPSGRQPNGPKYLGYNGVAKASDDADSAVNGTKNGVAKVVGNASSVNGSGGVVTKSGGHDFYNSDDAGYLGSRGVPDDGMPSDDEVAALFSMNDDADLDNSLKLDGGGVDVEAEKEKPDLPAGVRMDAPISEIMKFGTAMNAAGKKGPVFVTLSDGRVFRFVKVHMQDPRRMNIEVADADGRKEKFPVASYAINPSRTLAEGQEVYAKPKSLAQRQAPEIRPDQVWGNIAETVAYAQRLVHTPASVKNRVAGAVNNAVSAPAAKANSAREAIESGPVPNEINIYTDAAARERFVRSLREGDEIEYKKSNQLEFTRARFDFADGEGLLVGAPGVMPSRVAFSDCIIRKASSRIDDLSEIRSIGPSSLPKHIAEFMGKLRVGQEIEVRRLGDRTFVRVKVAAYVTSFGIQVTLNGQSRLLNTAYGDEIRLLD